MKIAVIANLRSNAPELPGADGTIWDDLDSRETVDAIITALERNGHEASFLEGRIDEPYHLVHRLIEFGPELCFNIAEGHFGPGREAHVPGILEMLRIPYTGSGVTTLALALDKAMTKRILHYHELPTPEFQVFGARDEEINDDLLESDALRFPLFVKPSREGTGIGVSGSGIVFSVGELRERVGEMLARFRQPILAERYIPGRELTVGILGNLPPTAPRRLNDRTAPTVLPRELQILPVLEIDLDRYTHHDEGAVYSNRIKTELVHEFYWTCPAAIPTDLEDRLGRLAAAVFRVIGCHDVARVDFRLDETGTPWILEVNPLPGLNPEYSDLVIEAAAAKIPYHDLIGGIVATAMDRIDRERTKQYAR